MPESGSQIDDCTDELFQRVYRGQWNICETIAR